MRISNTNLSARKGQIDINVIRSWGNTLILSSGVIIDGSNLRASKLKARVGTPPLTDSTHTSVRVVIYDGTTINTNSSNYNQGSNKIYTESEYLNANISITSNGGTGAALSGVIYPKAIIDSTASINISRMEEAGQNNIYSAKPEQENSESQYPKQKNHN